MRSRPSAGADALADCDWLDYGRDCYAGVTFSGLPDEERILIAWMGNWDYARTWPVDEEEPQRGAMTIARRLRLTSAEAGSCWRRPRSAPRP